jgi:flagellar biosynthesis protein FlhB
MSSMKFDVLCLFYKRTRFLQYIKELDHCYFIRLHLLIANSAIRTESIPFIWSTRNPRWISNLYDMQRASFSFSCLKFKMILYSFVNSSRRKFSLLTCLNCVKSIQCIFYLFSYFDIYVRVIFWHYSKPIIWKKIPARSRHFFCSSNC